MLLLVVAVVLMGVPPAEEEMLMATVCPSATPVVVPEMVTEDCSAALRNPSPPSLMATEMVGGVVSLEEVSVAWVAELPARSDTSAVMERVPSLREERSRFETE